MWKYQTNTLSVENLTYKDFVKNIGRGGYDKTVNYLLLQKEIF